MTLDESDHPSSPSSMIQVSKVVSTLDWSSTSESEVENEQAENEQAEIQINDSNGESVAIRNSFQLDEHLPFDSEDELFPNGIEQPKTKNEVDVSAIQDFKTLPFVIVPESMAMQPIGLIHAVVDGCLVVQSDRPHVPLDLESLLAIEDRTVLGKASRQ